MLEDPYDDPQPMRATISPYWTLAAILLGIVLALGSIFYVTRVAGA